MRTFHTVIPTISFFDVSLLWIWIECLSYTDTDAASTGPAFGNGVLRYFLTA